MNAPRRRPGPMAYLFAGLVLVAVVVVGRQLLAPHWPASARLERPASGAPAASKVEAATPAPPQLDLTEPQGGDKAAAAARRVGGVVRLPDGRPAAGATVTVLRASTDWPEWRAERLDHAITGLDGAFEFRLATANGILLAYEHPSFAGGIEDVPVALQRVELRLAPGFDLRGFVVNESGAPMANATVAIESVLADQRRVSSVSTSATGAYVFTNVPAGPVRVVASHSWWQPAVAPTVVIGATTRVDLRFDRPAMAPLRGRVVVAATQAPVQGASVEFLAPNGRLGLTLPAAASTGADGAFELAGLARGNHRVIVRHPQFGSVSRTLAVGPTTGELLLELPPRSRLRGVLVDESNASFAHAGAVLAVRDSAGELAFATLDGKGAFAIEQPLSPGWANVRVLDGSFSLVRSSSSDTSVRIEESDVTEVELSVRAPTAVRGRLVDDRGAPLAGVLVTQTRVLSENARWIGDAAAQLELAKAGTQLANLVTFDRDVVLAVSGGDGTFEFRGLQPGFMNARFDLAGYGSRWLRVPVPPLSRPVELGDVVLVRGVAARGTVLRNGAPVAGAPISVVGREAQAVAVTRGDGSFVVPDLPPGPYRLRARLPSTTGTTTEKMIELQPAGRGDGIELVLPAGRTLRGVVNGSDGQPVAGALVAVRGVAGQPVITDVAGEFALELPERAVELQVSLGDRSRDTFLAIAAEQQKVVVALDTPPTCTLQGSLVGLPGRRRLSGVLLRAFDLNGGLGDRTVWIDLQNGEFSWPLCPTGRVQIEIWAEGQAPAILERALAANEVHALGELLLEAGSQLRGRVVDPEGEPVADAAVFLGEESDLDLFEPRVRSDADGSFVVTGVTSRSGRLVVRARGFAVRSFDLRLPQDVLSPTPFQAQLSLGSTIEVVVGRPGVRETGIVQLSRRGRVVASVTVDDVGRALFANRSEGDYEVRLLGSDVEPQAVHVGNAGGVVRVRLQ